MADEPRNLYEEAHAADPTLPTAKADGIFSYVVMVHVHPAGPGDVMTKDHADAVVQGLMRHGVHAGAASRPDGDDPIVEAEIVLGPLTDPWGRTGITDGMAQSRELSGAPELTDEDRASTAPPKH